MKGNLALLSKAVAGAVADWGKARTIQRHLPNSVLFRNGTG